MSINLFMIFLLLLYCSVPDDYKVNPGPVESIAQHPNNPDKVNRWIANRIDKCIEIQTVSYSSNFVYNL